jgi:hypothetical protein
LRDLGRLIRSGKVETALLDRIEQGRALLEKNRASLAEGLANDRRTLDDFDAALGNWSSLVGEPLVLPAVVPYPALAAHALNAADPLLREVASALANDDMEAWGRVGVRSDAVAGSSWNPFLRLVAGYSALPVLDEGRRGIHSTRLFLIARQNLAWFRLVEAAGMVERTKRTTGRYPSDTETLDLPKDPFAPSQQLKYRTDANRYRLWSIGMNGVDDGGESGKQADLVLE